MSRILFVADQFADAQRDPGSRYPGGAELTDAAAIEACPPHHSVATVSFRELTQAHLDQHDVHLVGNSGTATAAQLGAIARAGRHLLFEHDVRICRRRGNFPSSKDPIHRLGNRCTCPHIAMQSLYRRALGVLFLTHRQLATFHANPFYHRGHEAVIGCSLFGAQFFEQVDSREPGGPRKGWWVLGSKNKIKGSAQAAAYCRSRGQEPQLLKDLTPPQVLERLGQAERFVYLPIGLEPAGRMPVEARFLGAEVTANGFVGVTGESWWRLPDAQALEVLRDGPARFWRLIDALLARQGTPHGRRSPEDVT